MPREAKGLHERGQRTRSYLLIGGFGVLALGIIATGLRATGECQGRGWSEFGGGVSGLLTSNLPTFVASILVDDQVDSHDIYIAGNFTLAGNVESHGIAKWNGSSWSPVGAGFNGVVRTLTFFDGGRGPCLIAGGDFTSSGLHSVNHVAMFNGSEWDSLGAGLSNSVNALIVFDDGPGSHLYAGGSFNFADGQLVRRVAKWTGNGWVALAGGTNGLVTTMASYVNDGKPVLVVAGSFMTAGGVPASRIAQWDGTSWTPLGDGLGSLNETGATVTSLVTIGAKQKVQLVAGGRFSASGAQPLSNVALWNGENWSNLGVGVNGAVECLYLGKSNDSEIFAGGTFSGPPGEPEWGQTLSRIARWDGQVWCNLDRGIGTTGLGTVFSIAEEHKSQRLFVGGDFLSASGTAISALGIWNGNLCSPCNDCNSNGLSDGCDATGIYKADTGQKQVFWYPLQPSDFLRLNQFTVNAGATVVSHIDVSFETAPIISPKFVLLYRDPNNDGNPIDAQLLAIAPAEGISCPGMQSLVRIPIGPTVIGSPGDSFFVGALFTATGGTSGGGSYCDEVRENSHAWLKIAPAGTIDLANLSLGPSPSFHGCNWLLRAAIMDCNQNNLLDECDIQSGRSLDLNGNGIPDECEQAPCIVDIAPTGGDGTVNVNDLLEVINGWGPCQSPPSLCPADVAPLSGDGSVNVNDLLAVINAWGRCE